MKRYLAAFLAVTTLLSLGVAVFAVIPATLTASNATFSPSSTCSGEMAAAGPSPNSDGYVGSFSFGYSIGGSGSISYAAVYALDKYDSSSDTWSRVGYTHSALSNSAGQHGTYVIDMYVDPGSFPAGSYALSGWVYTLDSSGNLGTLKASSAGQYVMAYDDPLPEPEPSPGPPGQGPPPTGGPVGPGSSICD